MTSPDPDRATLRTSIGELPLQEYHLRLGQNEWKILHTGAMFTEEDEQRLLSESPRPPYGITLWPAAIALAHDLDARADDIRARSVLELGAGTGLPGIVAATLGAHVVQTDRHEVPMSICRRNAERNGIATIEHRLADWTLWEDATRYDWIIGSDVLYSEKMHEHLRPILETNLAPGGKILFSDPFRPISLRFLDALERDGWRIAVTKWTVGEASTPRAIGVFDITRPF